MNEKIYRKYIENKLENVYRKKTKTCINIKG